LEADNNEIELRMLYKKFANEYYNDNSPFKEYINVSYRNWILNRIDLSKYENEVIAQCKMGNSFEILYRNTEFNINHFTQKVMKSEYDLIILDHIDYLDLNESKTENENISEIMKALRNINQLKKTPIIAVSHLRKSNDKYFLPTLDDLMGSSHKAKQAKTVIMISPDKSNYGADMRFGTYFQVLKSRFGSMGNLAGYQVFNAKTNTYEDNYLLYSANGFTKEITALDGYSLPAWAKNIRKNAIG